NFFFQNLFFCNDLRDSSCGRGENRNLFCFHKFFFFHDNLFRLLARSKKREDGRKLKKRRVVLLVYTVFSYINIFLFFFFVILAKIIHLYSIQFSFFYSKNFLCSPIRDIKLLLRFLLIEQKFLLKNKNSNYSQKHQILFV